MKTTYRSNLYALIILISWISGQYILKTIFHLIKLDSLPLYYLNFIINFILLFIPSIIYTKINNLSFKQTIRFNKINIFDLVIIFGFSFLIQPFMMFISGLGNLFFTNNLQKVFDNQIDLPIILLLISFAITPAIFEEIGTRGILLSGYDDIDIKIAAIINGIFFGCLHLNFQQFFYAFALGICFVYIVKATNSILASMFAHLIINSNQLLMSKLARYITQININNTQIQQTTLETHLSALAYILLMAIIFTPIAIYFIYLLFKKNNNTHLLSLKMNKWPSFHVMSPIYLIIIIFLIYSVTLEIFS